MKRYLFYCDTPYQIFTALNTSQGFSQDVSIDVVIYHQFLHSSEYSERLRKLSLFKNIFDAYPATSKIKDIFRLVFSKRYLLKDIGIRNFKYDKIFFSKLDTNSALALFSAIDYKEACQYEDGMFNYVGGKIEDDVNWKRRLLLKCSHLGVKYFEFSETYLFSLRMLSHYVPNLKEIKIQNAQILDDVFGYKENDFYRLPYIYLDQPYKGKEGLKSEFDRITSKYLCDISDGIVVRLHPRQKQSCIPCSQYDQCTNLWELECFHTISNRHVLISTLSTAQFLPYTMCNKHPHLIFLYKLADGLVANDMMEKFDQAIKQLKSLKYGAQIDIPSTWEELGVIINNLKHSVPNK